MLLQYYLLFILYIEFLQEINLDQKSYKLAHNPPIKSILFSK